MFKRWKEEMGKHDYDWRNPPTDPNACHCAKGIGSMRKRTPHDCGNPRCGICHPSKRWDRKLHRRERDRALAFEREAAA